MKTVYGPVPSWRLGKSLGVDPVCERACSFDCVYCQVGKTETLTAEQRKFVEAEDVERDLKEALAKGNADIITFSGMGEPTLASNIGELIDVARKLSTLPTAILTNSTLLSRPTVADGLKKLDLVSAKLDASSENQFQKINKAVQGINFEETVKAIKKFRTKFSGKLALQMMFLKENEGSAGEMAALAKEINPFEVQLNTPLRKCGVKPISAEKMELVKREFSELNAVSVYEAKKPNVNILNLGETLRRRPSE